jgi:hypothetical protein
MSKYFRSTCLKFNKCWDVSGAFSKTMTPSTLVMWLRNFFRPICLPEVIDWPSNSPDLNPIENLWSIIKTNVERRRPKNLDDLKCFMVEEWEGIPDSVIKNLIGSMRKRCEAVIERGGERISY